MGWSDAGPRTRVCGGKRSPRPRPAAASPAHPTLRTRPRRLTGASGRSCAQSRWRRSGRRCRCCWGCVCTARPPPFPSLSGTGWVSRDRRGGGQPPVTALWAGLSGREPDRPRGARSAPGRGFPRGPGGADRHPRACACVGSSRSCLWGRREGLGGGLMAFIAVPFCRRQLLQPNEHGLHQKNGGGQNTWDLRSVSQDWKQHDTGDYLLFLPGGVVVSAAAQSGVHVIPQVSCCAFPAVSFLPCEVNSFDR